MNSIIKFVGIIVAIGLLFGALMANGGLANYLHINSAILVIGGAFACGLMAGNLDRFIERAGDGAGCWQHQLRPRLEIALPRKSLAGAKLFDTSTREQDNSALKN